MNTSENFFFKVDTFVVGNDQMILVQSNPKSACVEVTTSI